MPKEEAKAKFIRCAELEGKRVLVEHNGAQTQGEFVYISLGEDGLWIHLDHSETLEQGNRGTRKHRSIAIQLDDAKVRQL